jgi:oxygen-independent coproporphyrinogen-3 oxidase
VRFANAEELGGYMLRGVAGEPLRVGIAEAFEETLFLGLRMNEGVSAAGLRESFPGELVAGFEAAAGELVREGLMGKSDGCWQLTLRGRMVSNEVFGKLLEGVAA